MDFAIPATIAQDLNRLQGFIRTHLVPDLPSWTQKQKIPNAFFHHMGNGGWFGFKLKSGHLIRDSALRKAMIAQELAKVSPGVAIVVLAHIDLGLMGLSSIMTRRILFSMVSATASSLSRMPLGSCSMASAPRWTIRSIRPRSSRSEITSLGSARM